MVRPSVPTTLCRHQDDHLYCVSWLRRQYLDFMAGPGAVVEHAPPTDMTTRFVYVYKGDANFNGETVAAGTVAELAGVGALAANVGPDGCGASLVHRGLSFPAQYHSSQHGSSY